MKKAFIAIGLLVCLVARGAATIDNMDELRRAYDLAAYDRVPMDAVKVAVLDTGFAGLVREDGSLEPGFLPPSATAVIDYKNIYPGQCGNDEALDPNVSHGAVMAQTAWAMTGNNPTGPEFFLLNANGKENFACAVKYARDMQVDIIGFSHNFPHGKFNGEGDINDIVNSATGDGILWFNSAGNYAGRVYNGPIEDKTFHIRSNLSDNPVTLSLAWTAPTGTDKDLDFEVKDPSGNVISVQNYKQVVQLTPETEEKVAPAAGPTETRYPFEEVTLSFDRTDLNDSKDTYTVRVTKRGGQFNASDSMRLTVLSPANQKPVGTSDGRMLLPIELVEATNSKEIMVPGDNPNVITVGDLEPWSARGPTLDGRAKPEILMAKSTVQLSSGREEAGTSHANFMMVGIAAQLVAQAQTLPRKPKILRADIIRFVQSSRTPDSVVRYPAEGSLPSDARECNPDTFDLNYPFAKPMLEALAKMSPKEPVRTFQRDDGSFILGINSSPSSIGGLWRSFTNPQLLQSIANNPDQFEYYLSMRNDPDDASKYRGYTAVRAKAEYTNQQLREKFPWEGLLDFKKSDFVELRRVQFTERRIPGRKVAGLWKTPSIAELKRVLSE